MTSTLDRPPASTAAAPGAEPQQQHDRRRWAVLIVACSAVFVTGGSSGVGSNDDYATIAYDAVTGHMRWVKRYNGSGNYADDAWAIAVSPDGSRVYVTGSFYYTYSIVTYAFDTASGASVWQVAYPAPYSEARVVRSSPDGNRVYVTGVRYGSNDYDYVVLAYDAATGTKLWTAIYDGPSHSADSPTALEVSGDGQHVFVP